MSLVVEKKLPVIKWYQNNNNVYFNILINNLDKKYVEIKNNKFILDNSDYYIEFELFDEFNHENIKYKETEKQLLVGIEKIKEDSWKYLVKNNYYKNNVKVDWDNWFDEDAEEDEEMDFSQMMGGGMPGMEGMMGGGMPGMGGGMPGMEGMMGGGMEGMEEMMANMGNMEGMEDDDDDEDDDEEDNDMPDVESKEEDCCSKSECCEASECCETKECCNESKCC